MATAVIARIHIYASLLACTPCARGERPLLPTNNNASNNDNTKLTTPTTTTKPTTDNGRLNDGPKLRLIG